MKSLLLIGAVFCFIYCASGKLKQNITNLITIKEKKFQFDFQLTARISEEVKWFDFAIKYQNNTTFQKIWKKRVDTYKQIKVVFFFKIIISCS